MSTVSLDAVEALARLQLAARRKGLDLGLHVVSRELRDLIELAGLTMCYESSRGRQAEEREQRLGVEEEGELGDPSSETSSTCSAHGSKPPPGSLGLYWPKAGEPFADRSGSPASPGSRSRARTTR